MNDFNAKSYWLASQDYHVNQPLREDLDTDFLIIGGGLTGLSAAYHLKTLEPGSKVTLIESDVIGYGASGRNAGFVMTLFGLTLSITRLRYGKEKAREAHHYMERAVDYSKAIIEQHQLDCEFEFPGFLRVATTPAYVKRIQSEIRLAEKLGLKGIEWIDKDAVRQRVNSETYLGAWWEKRCGLVNPAHYVREMKRLCESVGVIIYENTPATAVSLKPKIEVETPEGTIRAKKLMFALNAFSSNIKQLKRKQAPVITQIVLSRPLEDSEMAQIRWNGREGVEDARNLVHYYRLTKENRLLMGGGNVGLNYGNAVDSKWNAQTFEGLKKQVETVFPVLKGIEFTHQWGGPVSVPVDFVPAIGYAGTKDAVYSLGCVGHGVSMTQLNGKVAAELLLEKRSQDSEVFFVNRTLIPWFPEPIRYGVSHLAKMYMQLEDAFYER